MIRLGTKDAALAAIVTCAAASTAIAEDGDAALRRMLDAPRPIEAAASPWIEDLTWMEVRDAIAGGTTTAIIPTGGVEQNGPYLATGKHNVILREICPAIAAELGDALCAPIVGFVPEGPIDPPGGLMLFPGTISVREETFVALLTDIAKSLRLHGFTHIVLIGDSGGNQSGLEKTAAALNAEWTDAKAHFIGAFYEPGWTDTEAFAAEVLGVEEARSDGLHDDIYVTAMMAAADPRSVRHAERVEAGLASINGVDISDIERTADLGRRMIAFRAAGTAAAVRAARAED